MESDRGKPMPVTKRLTIENVNLDDDAELDAFDNQVITAGLERVRAEGDELRRRGILDAQGNLLMKELPADMKEGADRDFGG
jgi:hypothetical protein